MLAPGYPRGTSARTGTGEPWQVALGATSATGCASTGQQWGGVNMRRVDLFLPIGPETIRPEKLHTQLFSGNIAI